MSLLIARVRMCVCTRDGRELARVCQCLVSPARTGTACPSSSSAHARQFRELIRGGAGDA
eukprot:3113789-Pyramimonas_sp.AAC.1